MTAVIALAVVGGCSDGSDSRCTGQVCNGHIRDAEGRALVLRGVNLANAHKHAPYTSDFERADYVRLRADWGLDAVRFLITWSAIEPSPGVYNDAHLDWVAERLAWAHDAGLVVIVDMHQDVYGEGFGFDGAPRWTCDESHYAAFQPRQPWGINYADPHVMACFDHLWSDVGVQSSFIAAWRHVAERLADQPAVIGFDLINEPSWGTFPVASFERDHLQPLYERVIAEVRKAAPHWIAFVEPANSRNLGFATSLQPFAATDVVYAPHLYDTLAEQAGQFDPARRDLLIETAADLAHEAAQLGTPLWIGEYGGIGTDPNVGAYLAAAYDGTSAVSAGTMYWSYDRGGGYSLLDAGGGEVAPLVDAIVRPYPARVAGTPLGWSYDPASRTFEVRWLADDAIRAPTVLIAPTRLYPQGLDVECAGCTVDQVGDEIHVTAAGEVTARLTPR